MLAGFAWNAYGFAQSAVVSNARAMHSANAAVVRGHDFRPLRLFERQSRTILGSR